MMVVVSVQMVADSPLVADQSENVRFRDVMLHTLRSENLPDMIRPAGVGI